MLGWPNEGRSYDRIKLSLQRIANVTYNYDNAWWDPRQKHGRPRFSTSSTRWKSTTAATRMAKRGLFPVPHRLE